MCASVDPAIPVLEELISCDYEAARTRILVSGASSSCSQKIHNLQRGILKASQDSKYVLCLDDDVQLHPGFLQMAVSHMEADSAAFMLTGQLPSAAPPHPPLLYPTMDHPYPPSGFLGIRGALQKLTQPHACQVRFPCFAEFMLEGLGSPLPAVLMPWQLNYIPLQLFCTLAAFHTQMAISTILVALFTPWRVVTYPGSLA